MHTNTLKLLAVLFAVSFLLNDEAAELKCDIPKATWEPLFFEDINRLATKAEWKSLRETPLPSESLEVRVWIGFGLSPLEGYSPRRDGSHWTGRYIVDDFRRTNSISARSITPTSGWTNLWTTLVQLDLLTLPDASTLPEQQMVLDGSVTWSKSIRMDAIEPTSMAIPIYRSGPKRRKSSG